MQDEIAHDAGALLAEVERRGVTVLEAVPSLIGVMLEGKRLELKRLRSMMTTGEAISAELVKKWVGAYPEIPLDNAYGPTECSDDVTMHRLREEAGSRVAIGRATENTQLYILNGELSLVPQGATGELCVAGAGVGRGYVGQGSLTARDSCRTRLAGPGSGCTGREIWRGTERMA